MDFAISYLVLLFANIGAAVYIVRISFFLPIKVTAKQPPSTSKTATASTCTIPKTWSAASPLPSPSAASVSQAHAAPATTALQKPSIHTIVKTAIPSQFSMVSNTASKWPLESPHAKVYFRFPKTTAMSTTTVMVIYRMPLASETRSPTSSLLVGLLIPGRQGTKLAMHLVTKQWTGGASSRIRGTRRGMERINLLQHLVQHPHRLRHRAPPATMVLIPTLALISTILAGAIATMRLLCIRSWREMTHVVILSCLRLRPPLLFVLLPNDGMCDGQAVMSHSAWPKTIGVQHVHMHT